MATTLELVQLAQQRWRGREPISPTEWKNLLNDANDRVIAESPLWPFLETQTDPFTISANSQSKTLPDETWRVIQVYNTTDDIIMQPVRRLSEVYQLFEPDDTGEPELYRLISNELEVYPTPEVDTDIELIHINLPAQLTDNGQPVYPRIYHRILIDGALAHAYAMVGELEQAMYHDQKFELAIQEMRESLLQSREDSYPTIVDNWFDN